MAFGHRVYPARVRFRRCWEVEACKSVPYTSDSTPAREECSKHQIVAHSISEVTVDTLFSNQHVPCQPSFWSSSMAQSLGGLPHVATSKALRLYRLDVVLHRRIWWNITNHGSVPAVALFRRARCSSNYCQLCEYFPGHFFNQKPQPEL